MIVVLALIIIWVFMWSVTRNAPEATEPWGNGFRYKGLLYVYDKNTDACSIWYEWWTPDKKWKREFTGVRVRADELPEPVKKLVRSKDRRL